MWIQQSAAIGAAHNRNAKNGKSNNQKLANDKSKNGKSIHSPALPDASHSSSSTQNYFTFGQTNFQSSYKCGWQWAQRAHIPLNTRLHLDNVPKWIAIYAFIIAIVAQGRIHCCLFVRVVNVHTHTQNHKQKPLSSADRLSLSQTKVTKIKLWLSHFTKRIRMMAHSINTPPKWMRTRESNAWKGEQIQKKNRRRRKI